MDDSTRFESGLLSWWRLGGHLANRPFTTNTRRAYEDDYSKRRQSLQTGEKEVARHTRVIERIVRQPLEMTANPLAVSLALAAAATAAAATCPVNDELTTSSKPTATRGGYSL